jgi:hypothetical protein
MIQIVKNYFLQAPYFDFIGIFTQYTGPLHLYFYQKQTLLFSSSGIKEGSHKAYIHRSNIIRMYTTVLFIFMDFAFPLYLLFHDINTNMDSHLHGNDAQCPILSGLITAAYKSKRCYLTFVYHLPAICLSMINQRRALRKRGAHGNHGHQVNWERRVYNHPPPFSSRGRDTEENNLFSKNPII